jgi:hypothetical protein
MGCWCASNKLSQYNRFFPTICLVFCLLSLWTTRNIEPCEEQEHVGPRFVSSLRSYLMKRVISHVPTLHTHTHTHTDTASSVVLSHRSLWTVSYVGVFFIDGSAHQEVQIHYHQTLAIDGGWSTLPLDCLSMCFQGKVWEGDYHGAT